MALKLKNSYLEKLPEQFYALVEPTPVANPTLIRFNTELCEELGLDVSQCSESELLEVFSGNRILENSTPIALAYAGHQFGHFVPQLGDGRAVLLGVVRDSHGVERDIQLKGSGRTPFSRQGDGRSSLGPVIREYIMSEAMHALGVPSTRALAAVRTGESVRRETSLPGGVFTRVARSHIRVGTFEYFFARNDLASVRLLADYVISRHYPGLESSSTPYQDLLTAVSEVQAKLLVHWMLLGFIHGVMNTDNTSVVGETIDYGPCAFMDIYHPASVFSYIDRNGRYAYGNQPSIAKWNLASLAHTLAPLFEGTSSQHENTINEVLQGFDNSFQRAWLNGMRKKLGLSTEEDADVTLIEEYLDLMQSQQTDYTLSFRLLNTTFTEKLEQSPLLNLFNKEPQLTAWLRRWHARLGQEYADPKESIALLDSSNPALIPRNHRVEEAIVAAVEEENYSIMDRLLTAYRCPFTEDSEYLELQRAPRAEEEVRFTYCGT